MLYLVAGIGFSAFANFAARLAGAPPIRGIARAAVGEKGNNGVYFRADRTRIAGLLDSAARQAGINSAQSRFP